MDVLAEEKVVFGRQLSDAQKGSGFTAYVIYDGAKSTVNDTLDIILSLPHDEKYLHCKLSPEVKESLMHGMDAFYVEQYGEHLPEPPAQHQEEAVPSQMAPTM